MLLMFSRVKLCFLRHFIVHILYIIYTTYYYAKNCLENKIVKEKFSKQIYSHQSVSCNIDFIFLLVAIYIRIVASIYYKEMLYCYICTQNA